MCALVGAAAMLGGTGRCVLMTTVMMVEITGDPSMIAPVGISTLFAVIVGNWFNHGLYHSLIDVASMPFLPDRWPKEMPRALRVENILPEQKRMRKVESIWIHASRPAVEKLLKDSKYTCFPVLDDLDGRIVGLTTRGHLEYVLANNSESVDVGQATDFNYVTVRPSMPLEVAYSLFRRMEYSHIAVVSDDHKPLA